MRLASPRCPPTWQTSKKELRVCLREAHMGMKPRHKAAASLLRRDRERVEEVKVDLGLVRGLVHEPRSTGVEGAPRPPPSGMRADPARHASRRVVGLAPAQAAHFVREVNLAEAWDIVFGVGVFSLFRPKVTRFH